jgi:hypothetical protein
MQRTTIAAMQAMSESTSGGEGGNANPFMNPALWPWPFMGQTANPAAQAQPAQTAAPAEAPAEPKKSKPAKPAE